MGYLQIDGAYFDETPQGLQAVTDGNVLSRLKSGQLPVTKRSSRETSGLTFAGQKPLTSMNQTGNTDLPQTENRASGYQNFAAALNKAVSLARSQRNDASLDLVGGQIKPGSVTASTFTSLLSDINSASDNFTEPLVTDALDVAKIEEDKTSEIRDLALTLVENGAKKEVVQGILAAPDIDSAIAMAAGALNASSKAEVRSVGRSLVQVDPATGEVNVLYTAPSEGSGGGSQSETGFFKSGGLKIDNADIGAGSQMLAQMRGADGYTNSEKYAQMYQHWVDNGGLPQDFFKNYDPDYYLNPNDPTIPTYIKSQMKQTKTTSNPFAQ